MLDARRKLESIKLRPHESNVSLDVKSLYINVSVSEAIEKNCTLVTTPKRRQDRL